MCAGVVSLAVGGPASLPPRPPAFVQYKGDDNIHSGEGEEGVMLIKAFNSVALNPAVWKNALLGSLKCVYGIVCYAWDVEMVMAE